MLVSRNSIPVGARYAGKLSSISGKYQGNQSFYKKHKKSILGDIFPYRLSKHAHHWVFPESVFQQNHYFLRQMDINDDYLVYELKEQDFTNLRHELKTQGFDLLTEDQWEYALGGGGRHLFRWGSQLNIHERFGDNAAYEKVNALNMFGLRTDSSKRHYELTSDPERVKLGPNLYPSQHKTLLEEALPLSTYYQSAYTPKPTKYDSNLFYYRKMIPIGIV